MCPALLQTNNRCDQHIEICNARPDGEWTIVRFKQLATPMRGCLAHMHDCPLSTSPPHHKQQYKFQNARQYTLSFLDANTIETLMVCSSAIGTRVATCMARAQTCTLQQAMHTCAKACINIGNTCGYSIHTHTLVLSFPTNKTPTQILERHLYSFSNPS